MPEIAKSAVSTNRCQSLLLALAAHLSWGTYPVISKLLMQHVPTFLLVACGYVLALLLITPWRPIRQWQGLFTGKTAWLLMLASSIRMITNMLALKYTRVAYVQLIYLLTPYLVALLGHKFFKERVPHYTILALGISTLGSLLVIGGNGESVNLSNFLSNLTPQLSSEEFRGVMLAIFSTFFLAFYMLLTRYSQIEAEHQVDEFAVFIQQAVALMVTSFILVIMSSELAIVNLGEILKLPVIGLFIVFVGLNLVSGNFLQIAGLKRLGTPLFTSLIGIRLIVALALAALTLQEYVNGIQLCGAGIVIIAVTGYMLLQAQELPAVSRIAPPE
jgi:drug/metabolite transporter (DMT)-like permease